MQQHALDVRAFAGRSRARDPGQLPEGLRGPHHVIGGTLAQHAAGLPGDLGSHVLAHPAHLLRRRRVGRDPVPGEAPGADRQRGYRVRLLVDSRCHLERAAADVDHQQPPRGPAEPAPGGQEGKPRFLVAGHHVDLRTGLLADPGQDLLAVDGLPDSRGRERDDVLYALVLRDTQRLLDLPAQAALTRLGQRAAFFQVSGEPEFGLMRESRHGPRPRVGVHHEQVHRVRPHVQHPKSHTLTLPCRW